MGKTVVHVEVIGPGGKKLQGFYGKLFDWNVDANNPMDYGMVGMDQAGVGVGISAGQDANDKRVTFYVEVDDLNEYLKKAESLGGKTIMGPMDVPGGPQLAMFADPDGNVIGMTKAGSMQGS